MHNKPVIGFVIVSLISIFARTMIAAEKKPWKDMTVQVGDVKVHYLEAGTGDRPLVFLPGWTMTAEVWREQIPYFASRGFHVFAIDPRSQGSTTKTEAGNTYHQQAADLHAFMKAVKIDHVVFVGWSAGVTVLLEYISSPDTLKPEKLVFVDGGPTLYKQEDYPGGMTIQEIRNTVMSIEEDRAKFTDRFVRSMFKSKQTEFTYKELADGSMKTPIGAALALYFDLFTGDHRLALAHVSSPSLIVVSPENRMLGEYLQSKIPESKLEVVPEAGHAMFLEKPQAFNQILEAFVGADTN
jgi:non-heme chloroperoxidase